MPNKQFLTVKEIADILKVSFLTVYEYIKSGKLKALKLGRNYRVAIEEFQDFVRRNSS